LSADRARLEVKLPLRDASGNIVGAAAIVFPSNTASQDSLIGQAEKIRDEIQRKSVNLAALYGPYPVTRPEKVAQTEYDKAGARQPAVAADDQGESLGRKARAGFAGRLFRGDQGSGRRVARELEGHGETTR